LAEYVLYVKCGQSERIATFWSNSTLDI